MRLSLLREVPLVHLVTRWIKQWVFITIFHIRGTRAVERPNSELEERRTDLGMLVVLSTFIWWKTIKSQEHFWSQTLMLGWVWPQWKAKRLKSSPYCFISWPCTEDMYSKRAFYCSNILYVVCFGCCTLIYFYKHYSVTVTLNVKWKIQNIYQASKIFLDAQIRQQLKYYQPMPKLKYRFVKPFE